MIGIIDYGMGNLRSVQKAVERSNVQASIITQPQQFAECDKLILPGVGAFKDAIQHLNERDMSEPIRAFVASGKPMLGICLGLQLLFDVSEEDGEHEGLGLIGGRVVRFQPDDHALKVPHMGWNAINWSDSPNPLLTGITPGSHVYFVHSYFACPTDDAVIGTTTDYAGTFCSSVRKGNLYATQFHPEKSQNIGLRMLANFVGL